MSSTNIGNNVTNNIKNTIQNLNSKLSDGNYVVIVILLITLVVLFILFFQYTFEKRNLLVTKKLDYEDKINLQPILSCGEITDPLENYILADYYIASSYNTYLIGNQKYDYVSVDIIKTVLESGARYIELEICKDNISENSNPVIATGDKTGDWINSLNILALKETIKIIRNFAFIFRKKHINYPLFINLKLNTNDKTILNTTYNIIHNELKQYILDPIKYHKFPISLERLCNLNNKIIFFAEGEWFDTELAKIVVPTHQFMQKIHYKEINKFSPSPYKRHSYTNSLSQRTEKGSLKLFEKKYPTLDSVKDKLNTIKNEIMSEDGYINKLEQYNKLGLTIVYPHKKEDIFSLNYNPDEAFKYGCNFICMNYQINDDIMNDYLTVFSESSFVLKQRSLRFHRKREDVLDLNTLYPSTDIEDNLPLVSDFYEIYKNKVYSLNTLDNQELLLTEYNQNIIFSPKINKLNTKKELNNKRLKQCFIFNKSKKYSGAITIQSVYNNYYLYYTDDDEIFLKPYDNTKDFYKNTSFYPIYPKCEEEKYISFRTVHKNKIKLMGSYGSNHMKLFDDTNSIKLKSVTCFYPNIIPTDIYITIKSVDNGSILKVIRTMGPSGKLDIGGGLIFINSKKITDDMKFKVVGDYPEGDFYLQASNGRYIRGILKDKLTATVSENNRVSDALVLNIRKEGSLYNIVTKNNEYLTINRNMSVTLEKDKPLITPAVYDDKNIQLSINEYGPTLGNKKRYVLKSIYQIR